MAEMVKDAMPLLMKTLYWLSTEMVTSSSGSLRMMSKKSRAGMTHVPVSAMSAETVTVMPVSKL